MEEVNCLHPVLPQPVDLTQPVPDILQQLNLVLDKKRVEKFGTVAIIARQLQTQGHMSERTAFRLLRQIFSNKPPRKVTAFLLALQALGYTAIRAEAECEANPQHCYPSVQTDTPAP